MILVIPYLLRSSIYLSVLFAFFLLVMRQWTFYRFNRMVLIIGSTLCLLLPFSYLPSISGIPAVDFVTSSIGASFVLKSEMDGNTILSWQILFTSVYLIGFVVALFQFGRSYWRMIRLMQHIPSRSYDKYLFYITHNQVPSFSWFRNILISQNDFLKHPSIIAHEIAHAECKHSFDIVFFSLITSFQWFNPLAWMCFSEIKMIHEYEADKLILDQGYDISQYQLLLVKKAVGDDRFIVANSFNSSRIKKRIRMMQKKPMEPWKRLFLIPGVALLLATVLVFGKERSSLNDMAPIPFSEVEIKPLFNGEEAAAFSYWVNNHLVYPQESNGVVPLEKVDLQFTIDAYGFLVDAKVLSDSEDIFNQEALRVLSLSPRWDPAMQDGRPVPVTISFSVYFQYR